MCKKRMLVTANTDYKNQNLNKWRDIYHAHASNDSVFIIKMAILLKLFYTQYMSIKIPIAFFCIN